LRKSAYFKLSTVKICWGVWPVSRRVDRKCDGHTHRQTDRQTHRHTHTHTHTSKFIFCPCTALDKQI